jgi:hypothetical protein
MYRGISVSSNVMLSIPNTLEKKYIPLQKFISDVVMSCGNLRFLFTNLQAQIWGVTIWTHEALKWKLRSRGATIWMTWQHCLDAAQITKEF